MAPRLGITGIAALAATAVVALAGCGGDDEGGATAAAASSSESAASSGSAYGSGGSSESSSGSSSGAGSTLRVAADPGGALRFEPAQLEAKAGTTTVRFENASGIPHAVEIEGNGVEEETETITDGEAELTVDLKPGTYEFYCPVGDHAAQGMKGELTVR